MRIPTIPQERQPMVCLLFGLLLIASGLWVGFDSTTAIGSMIVGLLVSVFGLILFVLQLQERPRQTATTRLSPDFISAGSTVQMPAPQPDNEAAEQQAAG